jgi:O-6-methylguanine DNA methyltransferase
MKLEAQLASLALDAPKTISEGVALGTGLADGYDLFPSPVGEVAVAFNPEGVSFIGMVSDGFHQRFTAQMRRELIRAEAPAAWGRHIPAAIEAGSPGKVPVDLRPVTRFQASVLRLATTIPRGEVRPYGWVAKELGRPAAVRAVGSALARNPIPLMIPCHRVVRTDGHIGNYSLIGPEVKLELLEKEGAQPAALEELASRGVRIRGNSSTGIFCHPTCQALRRSKPGNVVDFQSAAQAADAGFRPCLVCRPA